MDEVHVKEWREKGQQAPRDPKWTPNGAAKGAEVDDDAPAGDDQPAGSKAPFPEDKPGKKPGKTDGKAKPGAKKPAAKKPTRGGR